MKNLTDEPGDLRKLHSRHIPTLGGVIIFAGTLFSVTLWMPILATYSPAAAQIASSEVYFLIAALLIMFFIGIKDDIVGTSAIYKLLANIMVGMVLVLMADIRILGFHGLFGIHKIPYWASVFLSVLTFVVTINAFNFIDGLDGLAGGIGFIISAAFGIWFILSGNMALAGLAFALSGALLGFLIYNFSPAKIFMGDSGSLFIGLILCTLGIMLIKAHASELPAFMVTVSRPLLVMGLFAYPLMDLIRVTVIRVFRGVSPFTADRNHIHHVLIDLNLGHRKSSIFLYMYTIVVGGLVVLVRGMDPTLAFVIVGSFAVITLQIPIILRHRLRKRNTGIVKEMDHQQAM